MVIFFIYSVVILFACIIGAIVGLGGGVLIRPILDAIGYHDVLNISFVSSSAVLTMATVSTIFKVRSGTRIDAKVTAFISVGAIIGGIIGNIVLEHMVGMVENESGVQMVQIILTIMVLVASIILTTKNTLRYDIKNYAFYAIFGTFMGAIGAFLGIGGGPINIPLLMIFLGLNVKDAAAYSIVIVFFAHLSRLVTTGFTIGYDNFDLPVLVFVIPAATLGGLIGGRLSNVFSEKVVKRLFIGALLAVIALNIANGISIIW